MGQGLCHVQSWFVLHLSQVVHSKITIHGPSVLIVMLVASISNLSPCPSWAGGLRDLAMAFSCPSSNKVLEATNPACNQVVACTFRSYMIGAYGRLWGRPVEGYEASSWGPFAFQTKFIKACYLLLELKRQLPNLPRGFKAQNEGQQ